MKMQKDVDEENKQKNTPLFGALPHTLSLSITMLRVTLLALVALAATAYAQTGSMLLEGVVARCAWRELVMSRDRSRRKKLLPTHAANRAVYV